ncbi:hypothetical protein FRB94_014455 [Tulasnella sp. JGI-2019a]|nr:hypothetical protein FRB94_014455 [Tulasnella sp. JGI-2019a]
MQQESLTPQIDPLSIPASSSLKSQVQTFCLPPELEKWFEVDLENDPRDPTWIAAWTYFASALSSHGYHLFFTHILRPEDPSPTLHSADFFSPPRDPFRPGEEEAFVFAEFPYPLEREFTCHVPTVFPGYDFKHREVIIKALRTESGELSILETLSGPQARSNQDNHTIPVLAIVPVGGWTLVVMPAWGRVAQFAPISIGEYLQHVEQYLEGLAFMHNLGITHGDISQSNVLLNHRSNSFWIPNSLLDRRLFDLRVAYIDFGLARQFNGPPEALATCDRLVSSGGGTEPFISPEVARCLEEGGKWDAFSADVYSLAAVIQVELDKNKFSRTLVAQMCPIQVPFKPPVEDALSLHVPQLSELLRRMTTDVPEKRPSAQEALLEVRRLRQDTDPQTLALPGDSQSTAGPLDGSYYPVLKQP